MIVWPHEGRPFGETYFNHGNVVDWSIPWEPGMTLERVRALAVQGCKDFNQGDCYFDPDSIVGAFVVDQQALRVAEAIANAESGSDSQQYCLWGGMLEALSVLAFCEITENTGGAFVKADIINRTEQALVDSLEFMDRTLGDDAPANGTYTDVAGLLEDLRCAFDM